MRFHRMAIFVSDMDAAVKLWRDVLGFPVMTDKTIPDEQRADPTAEFGPKPPNDIADAMMARSRIVVLSSSEGALIELQQREIPRLWTTRPPNLRYQRTGILELALQVTDIDAWFVRVRAAGYSTQTEHVWKCADTLRSFLFFDQDTNLIQMWEPIRVLSEGSPIQL